MAVGVPHFICSVRVALPRLYFASVQAWPTSRRCSWIECCLQFGFVRTAMLAEARAADVDAKRARGDGGIDCGSN